ncbi:hypothetical protein GWI33_020744 [Rhynchophorus ferrugineus]|uniref:GTPase Era, mitochondrial n=1 Tax=Rhynchophorus ferrugineus TaxID=354439 RepID=A0A834HVL0_RHYFE|nr:hypothetical protein GWI33_020744 [Rhynchophorus ferrugineus]
MVLTTLKVFKSYNIFTVLRHYSLESAANKTVIPVSDENLMQKLLRVGIIGMPNAGKSTFINNLMERMVCPASSKIHTTRSNSMAIFTEGDTQIVFVDTPGVVNEKEYAKFHLNRAFKRDAKRALKNADIIGVIHDVSNIHTKEKLDIKILNLLQYHKDKPSFLIFNKVDLLRSKRKLLDLTRVITENSIDGKPISGSQPRTHKVENEYKGWPYFQEVFMVSSLMGDGLIDVKKYLLKQGKSEKWMFPEEIWTDQSAEDMILKTVQAKLLDFLPQEIPYNLKSDIEYFNVNSEGILSTVVIVNCPSIRVARLIAGACDGRLRQIIQSVQQDLQSAFNNFVRLKIVLYPPYKE